jgi:hypothetical protein
MKSSAMSLKGTVLGLHRNRTWCILAGFESILCIYLLSPHGLLQGEPSIYHNVKMGVLRPKRWVYYPGHSYIVSY